MSGRNYTVFFLFMLKDYLSCWVIAFIINPTKSTPILRGHS
ncbi:unnamed protein product [Arabidopsis halleri]